MPALFVYDAVLLFVIERLVLTSIMSDVKRIDVTV